MLVTPSLDGGQDRLRPFAWVRAQERLDLGGQRPFALDVKPSYLEEREAHGAEPIARARGVQTQRPAASVTPRALAARDEERKEIGPIAKEQESNEEED